MDLSLLLIIPAILIAAILIVAVREGTSNPLPKILGITIGIILIGSLLVPVIQDANADESVVYDDYIEISSDTYVDGVFEKLTSGDKTYAHANGIGKGMIGSQQYNVHKADLDVFFIMGQSNAAYSYYDASSASPVAELGQTYYYGTETQPVTQSVTGTGMYDAVNLNGTAKIGHLEQPFMAKYSELSGHKVYTINTGWNGASISVLTVGGSHYNYEQRTINAGLNAINMSDYNRGNFGMIWLQGESDAGLGTPVDEYKADFLALFDAMRHEGPNTFSTLFELDNAFIVQTRTARGPNTAEALTELAEENDHIYMATEITLTFTDDNGYLRGDDLHYSQTGFNLIGVAVAEFIVENHLT